MNIFVKIAIFVVSSAVYMALNIFSFFILFSTAAAAFMNANLGGFILLIALEGCVFWFSLWGMVTLGRKLFIVKK
ncbi:MAG TPA: hypothetical protein VGE18_01270 [Candidatus Paceibacterota bacterium]